MKVPIGPTDFAINGPWYSYDDKYNDYDLRSFSVAKDLEKNGNL